MTPAHRFLLPLAGLVFLSLALPAQAEELTYFEDPVYKLLNDQDHHPLEDMILLAEGGDTRAQFIMGDMMAKGKGGFGKSEKKARDWFEMAARQGNFFAYIRLAAMAKRHGDWTEAYQWYDLAVDDMTSGPDRDWAKAQREKLVKSGKVSKDDIDKAEDMADDWRKKSRELLAKDRERQKELQEKIDTLDVGDKTAADPKMADKKTPEKDKPADKPVKKPTSQGVKVND